MEPTTKPKKTISLEELLEADKEDRLLNPETISPLTDKYYMPRLGINDPTMYENKPMSERRHLTDKVGMETCLGNCCGVPGLKAGCCSLDPTDLDHVLGPVDEPWIKRICAVLSAKSGISVTRNDVVIDFEEGKVIGEAFFGGHKVFQSKEAYPIIRMQVNGPRFACKYLNPNSGKCNIYDHRPDMCRKYYCNFIKANFLVRTREHPNTFKVLK